MSFVLFHWFSNRITEKIYSWKNLFGIMLAYITDSKSICKTLIICWIGFLRSKATQERKKRWLFDYFQVLQCKQRINSPSPCLYSLVEHRQIKTLEPNKNLQNRGKESAMELELGLKITRTREDISSSVDFRFSKDPFGPLVLSRETDSRFIIIIHLKGRNFTAVFFLNFCLFFFSVLNEWDNRVDIFRV